MTEPARPAEVQPDTKAVAEPPVAPAQPMDTKSADRTEEPAKQASAPRTVARLGRLPGRRSGESRLKAKTTIWVTAELIDEYREWSWEERCGFGELVERALVAYKQHRKGEGNDSSS